jgi:hypothetical protein
MSRHPHGGAAAELYLGVTTKASWTIRRRRFRGRTYDPNRIPQAGKQSVARSVRYVPYVYRTTYLRRHMNSLIDNAGDK